MRDGWGQGTFPVNRVSCGTGRASAVYLLTLSVTVLFGAARAMQLMNAGWKLWPAVGLITYTIIPLRHRLLWVDAIEIVYR